jgi:membrane-bound lytic murein transglycosylase D
MRSLALRWLVVVVLLASGAVGRAAQDTVTVEELLHAGRLWVQANLDETTLHSLGADPQALDRLLQQFQQRLQGGYVVDLAALKATAQALVPLLEAHEETQPYAAWLKSRLDYLEVAEQLRPPATPGKAAPATPSNPTAEQARKVWRKQLQARPWPKGAQTLVPVLKPLFLAQGVPAQLVWLAEVESTFDPAARSPAGALGLFQLMPTTARAQGLSLWPRDQRRDPEKSATAAARQLHALHHQFKDWRLALAAYNAGAGRVAGLLQKSKAKTFDAIAPRLPAETQMYVPKVEAVLLKREGVLIGGLQSWAN